MTRSIWTLVISFTVAGATAASAQQPSEARIQELIRAAAARMATQPSSAGQGVQAPSAPDTRPVVRMALDDAVKLALERNLDIAVQRLNPQINDIAIASVLSVYHPTLTSTVTTQAQANPSATTLAGSNQAGAAVDTTLDIYNAGITQSVPWFGSSLALALNNNRQTTTNLTSLYNPTYNTNWSFQYVQPFMRGFRIDNTRQQLQVSKINRDISDVQLRASITNTVSNVRNAYWDFVFATQAVEVAQRSLDLASKLVQDNQTRVQVGTMAPIDVVQAQAEQATRRQALVTAESTRRTTELALKRMIVSGTEDANWGAALDPTDRPEFRAEAIDVEGAIRRALSERTDLDVARKNVSGNDVTLRYLKDQLLPQADVTATYGLVGLGGAQLITSGTGVNRTVTGAIPGGYFDALTTLLGRNYPRWTVSLNFSYPIGQSAQEAAVARANVQLNQVQAQLKQIELQIATDVTNAAIQARNTAEAVQAAQASRELAQRKLEAEQSKFEVGMSTNYFVVQAQRDLADAANSELRAILNYRKSLVEFERVQQTTLQGSGITVLQGGGGVGGATATTRGAAGGNFQQQ